MSRIGKAPIAIPAGVTISEKDGVVTVKGAKGENTLSLISGLTVSQEDGQLSVVADDKPKLGAMMGTTRALIANMVVGASDGFQKQLKIVGVGYRAKAQGKILNLQLGFSHDVNYSLPEGVSAETPSQTDIILTGSDKQKVGQAAANIRAFRPPEPYKGKGIRYSDEYVVRKQAKKA